MEKYNKYHESLDIDYNNNSKLDTLKEFANANSFLFWSKITHLN